MAIINKGILDTEDLYERRLSNDWPTAQRLYTAEVYESASNLYYTNARVQAYLDSQGVGSLDLSGNTTTDLAEGDNLYYTNSRVLSHLANSDVSVINLTVGGNLFVQGNVTSLNTAVLNVEDKNIVLANGAPNPAAADGAGITIEGANLTIAYSSASDYLEINKIVAANIVGQINSISNHSIDDLNDVDTAGAQTGYALIWDGEKFVTESVTNASVQAAIEDALANLVIDVSNINVDFATISAQVQSISNWTTSNLAEGTNLYYTNARVQSYINQALVGAGTDLSSNTTTDLAEGTNLYYTNTRVLSAVNPLLVTSNVIEGTNLYYTNTRVKTYVESLPITLNGNTTTDLSEGNNLYYTNTRVKTYVESLPITLNGNTTTDLSEGNNLYYTNARVKVYVDTLPIDLSGNTTTELSEGDNLYYTNARVQAYLAGINLEANIAGNINLDNFTTSNLVEGTNLYFTNTRAISSFTAGRGITISQSGLITSDDDSYIFNLAIDGAAYSNVASGGSNVLTLAYEDENYRYMIRSVHLTNISEEDVYFSGNMILSGNIVGVANKIPLPYGTSVEFIEKEQVLLGNDIIQINAFDSSLTPASNLISVTVAYETIVDTPGLNRSYSSMSAASTNYTLLDSEGKISVIEGIRFSNLSEGDKRVNLMWTDANSVVKSYLAYNLAIPQNSAVEVLSKPKKIDVNDKLLVSMNSNSLVTAIASYRQSVPAQLETFTQSVSAGSNVTLQYSTDIEEGTTIHYTIV